MNTENLKTIANSVTENGRLKETFRKAIFDQVRAKLTDFETMPNGRLSMPVAIASDGEIIFANIDLKIGKGTKFEKTANKTAGKTTEKVDIPNLFD